jgi:hypothetical protein
LPKQDDQPRLTAALLVVFILFALRLLRDPVPEAGLETHEIDSAISKNRRLKVLGSVKMETLRKNRSA